MSDLLPLALVVAASPFQIIVAVLLLFTPRARATSTTFLVGWALPIAALTTVFLLLADVLEASDYTPRWVNWARIALGLVLLALGIRKWLTRRKKSVPGWLQSIESADPTRAFRFAVTLAVLNPKVLLMAAAAGFSIGAQGLSAFGQATSVAVFTVVAASSVLLPVVLFLVMGDAILGPMRVAKDWLLTNNAILLSVVLVVIGAVVLTEGITGL
jgi:threonine/homoserine/homoserine lactone efflux protein